MLAKNESPTIEEQFRAFSQKNIISITMAKIVAVIKNQDRQNLSSLFSVCLLFEAFDLLVGNSFWLLVSILS
jgi:hypothetical protein